MRIDLDIGNKSVVIESHIFTRQEEINTSWPEIMNELVFPALRGWGFVIDNEFSDTLSELHKEYLSEHFAIRSRKK